MKSINIRPSFRYISKNLAKSTGIFYGLIFLVTVGSIASFIKFSKYMGEGASSTISAFGVSAVITVFVFGICSVRENLRICIQHGVSRGTAFVSEICAAAFICFALAIAGEVMLAAAQRVIVKYQNIRVVDMYQSLFAGETIRSLSFTQHVVSMLLNYSMIFAAYIIGMFISLVFFRLNKLWTIVTAIGVPVFFLVGLPILMRLEAVANILISLSGAYVKWVLSSPWLWILASTFTAALFTLFNWLLTRRAPIKSVRN